MRHDWLRYLVPREWSGSQALAAVGLLQQALDAIWLVHGEQMADVLGELGPESPVWQDAMRDEVTDREDDIPF